MSIKRMTKSYTLQEVMDDEAFVSLMEVCEHQWLLEHSHEFPEIIYIRSGHGLHYVNQTSNRVQPGDIIVIPLGTSHVFRPATRGDQPLSVCNLIVRPTALREWRAILPDAAIRQFIAWMLGETAPEDATVYPPWLHLHDDEQHCLHTMILSLRTTLQQAGPLQMTQSWLHTVSILRQLCLTAQPDAAEREHDSWKNRVHAALSRLHPQAVSVATLAEACGVSERHLSRSFRDENAQPLQRYVLQWRMELARQRLASGQTQIDALMRDLGIRDRAHFYRTFKDHIGLTPSEYIRRFLPS